MAKHWSEDSAKNYLIGLGYKFIANNYHMRGGEIDLIMQDNEVLVFVEVKQRKSVHFGKPAETITVAKLQRIQNTALKFVQEKYNRDDLYMRFDAVLLVGEEDCYRLEHIQNISL